MLCVVRLDCTFLHTKLCEQLSLRELYLSPKHRVERQRLWATSIFAHEAASQLHCLLIAVAPTCILPVPTLLLPLSRLLPLLFIVTSTPRTA
ncbi:unnamed protein product [Taenia asiatica]|uniref:Uncharacterized protein n=1 Tax=Taenia asiatica TaxID=60517 RepID=A0A0R3WGE8_TAEAS|nr:unnamed protein product [Taenia asiatica]